MCPGSYAWLLNKQIWQCPYCWVILKTLTLMENADRKGRWRNALWIWCPQNIGSLGNVWIFQYLRTASGDRNAICCKFRGRTCTSQNASKSGYANYLSLLFCITIKKFSFFEWRKVSASVSKQCAYVVEPRCLKPTSILPPRNANWLTHTKGTAPKVTDSV